MRGIFWRGADALPPEDIDCLLIAVNVDGKPILKFGFYLDGVWVSSGFEAPLKVKYWCPVRELPVPADVKLGAYVQEGGDNG